MAYGRLASIGEITLDYGTSPNATIIQTIDNVLLFCGDIEGLTVAGNQVFGHLPNNLAPNAPICILLYASIPGNPNIYQRVFTIDTNGDLFVTQGMSNATLHTNGLCVNINDVYYNSTIGNNDMSQMTYPMGRA